MQPEAIHAAGQMMTPFLQYGFAGFAFLQLGVIVWFANKAVQVIARNTQVLEQIYSRDIEQARKVDEIRDMLLSRPCIKD